MADVFAHFLTWTTYGTWLSGDARGWVKRGGDGRLPSVEDPNPALAEIMRRRLKEPPLLLDHRARRLVDGTIRDHCRIKRWDLHALNVRTNHVHVLVSSDIDGDTTVSQFKQWSTRRLREGGLITPDRTRVWTANGSTLWVADMEGVERVSRYILEEQDGARFAEA